MPVLPDRDLEQIQFCETHIPVWNAAPASVGLTAAQVTQLTSLTTAARASFNTAQSSRETSRGATTTFHGNLTSMRNNVADLIRIIKGFAESQSDPTVIYGKAQIPQPAAPTPAPLPGRPKDLAVTLNPDGSITLTWTATDASASGGAFFNITRKLPGQTGFTPIGGAPGSTSESGRKMSFTDSTVRPRPRGPGLST